MVHQRIGKATPVETLIHGSYLGLLSLKVWLVGSKGGPEYRDIERNFPHIEKMLHAALEIEQHAIWAQLAVELSRQLQPANHVEARLLADGARTIAEKSDDEHRPSVERTLNDLGSALMNARDIGGARDVIERSLAMSTQSSGNDHIESLTHYANLGAAAAYEGKLEESTEIYET